MSRMVRIVVAWLLAAALPLQGAVAASMALCGTLGEGSAAHRQVDGGHAGALPMIAVHVHDVAASHAEPVAAHAGHGRPDAEPRAGHGAGKCSVCAACCAGVAIAVADFMLDLAPVSESFAASITTASPPFLTEGLERPPRSAFA